ncbi:hypothetical protein GS429_04235 [Natronorubrum sp. JWXQ-INN-674]|uniref:Uncharacterized protein n=2 Tax=cellular organisms TaxID=131567 RepID=A0A6B0VID9_9EURY|nr:hypothetical protein [Natronorubrum halalkaliphilum]MXV61284.1 hypothetical protein [Natronorubrum halalkaliphilum]
MSTVEDRPDDELELVASYLKNEFENPTNEEYFVTHTPNQIYVWETKFSVEDPDFPASHPTTHIEDQVLWHDSVTDVLEELNDRGILSIEL